MHAARCVILTIGFFCFSAALFAAGQSRAAGDAGRVTGTVMQTDKAAAGVASGVYEHAAVGGARAVAFPQIEVEGATYSVMSCRDLRRHGKNLENAPVALRGARILKTDLYDAYRRQIFASDRTGRYKRIFVDLSASLSAELEKMEGKTGTLYGSLQIKPSPGSFIVTRWERHEEP